ncbi:hypothetical protein [Agromyces sp. GXS1127]|uniref:hypothetical protein n=1 Tax=Agromyces sp. GXS1127 TaxID=3424181 RepID=UPI003D31BD82
MTDEPEKTIGYQSAMDIPRFAEMKRTADGFKVFGVFLSAEDRQKTRELTAQLHELAAKIDRFYELLGERHWIFHEQLPTAILDDATTADEAENRLCALYQDADRLRRMVQATMRFPGMRARRALIEKAMTDFTDERFYAVVLVLLTIMDGFVNEVRNEGKGLHARTPEEVESWDTAVGHHMGLTNAQVAFRKSYKKRVDTEHFELGRNGILHGMVTNYDNLIVASKAWNRLFAVVDWAASLEKREKPKKPEPTWPELIEQWQDLDRQKKANEQWRPSSGVASSPEDYSSHAVMVAASEFLELWRKSNWGHLAARFMPIGTGAGACPTPKEIKQSFEPYKVEGYRIVGYETKAPARAEVRAELDLAGQTFQATLAMNYVDLNGEPRVEGIQDGEWKVFGRSPEMFSSEIWRVAKFR